MSGWKLDAELALDSVELADLADWVLVVFVRCLVKLGETAGTEE